MMCVWRCACRNTSVAVDENSVESALCFHLYVDSRSSKLPKFFTHSAMSLVQFGASLWLTGYKEL